MFATALASEADAIVSGNAYLLILGGYEAIHILSPRQFVELLDA